MGSKLLESKLIHRVVVPITAYNSFVPLLKSFIANVLKCRAQNLNAYALICVS